MKCHAVHKHTCTTHGTSIMLSVGNWPGFGPISPFSFQHGVQGQSTNPSQMFHRVKPYPKPACCHQCIHHKNEPTADSNISFTTFKSILFSTKSRAISEHVAIIHGSSPITPKYSTTLKDDIRKWRWRGQHTHGPQDIPWQTVKGMERGKTQD